MSKITQEGSADTELVTDSNNREEKNKNKRIGYLFRLLAVFIWGIQPLYLKYSPTKNVPPELTTPFIAIGGSFTLLLILIFFYASGKKEYWKPKVTVNKLLFSIVIFQAAFWYLMNLSLSLTASTHFILLNNFAPICALLIALLLWKKEIPYLKDKKNIAAIFLVFFVSAIGGALVLYSGIVHTSGSIKGDSFAIFAMLVDVVLVVSQIRYAKFLKRNQSVFLSFYMMIFVSILCTPVIIQYLESIKEMPFEYVASALFAGFLAAIGLVCNYEAFRRMDGFIAFLMFNISIFITFSIESFVLKEITVSSFLMIGGFIIIVSSIMAEAINTRCDRK